MGNNEICAIANASQIEKLPYETLKAMFPSVRYMVHGETWVRKFIAHKKNEITGKQESYAVGEWLPDHSLPSFPDPTTATICAKRKYTKGHYRVVAFVPELHPISNRIVSE